MGPAVPPPGYPTPSNLVYYHDQPMPALQPYYSPYNVNMTAYYPRPAYHPPPIISPPNSQVPTASPPNISQPTSATATKRKPTSSATSRNDGRALKKAALAPAIEAPGLRAPTGSHPQTCPLPPLAPRATLELPFPSPSPAISLPRSVASICGVGPTLSAASPLPPSATSSGTPSPAVVGSGPTDSDQRVAVGESTVPFPTTASKAPRQLAATDVYYFLRPLLAQGKIPVPPPEEEKRLTEKPNSPFIGCRLCSELPTPVWKVWKNGSITDTLRDHFRRHHEPIWTTICEEKKLKGHQSSQSSSAPPARKIGHSVFSIELVRRRLVEWIVADDQSLRVVDVPEFRRLILAVGAGNLVDGDLPHRTLLTKLIAARHHAEEAILKNDLQNSIGRISCTTDMWSDGALRSFLAISVHYCKFGDDGNLRLETQLLAFRHVVTDHSGASISKVFFDVIEDDGISGKIGQITADNASNNNTFMSTLSAAMGARGIKFDAEGSRVHCFPHVVNLSVQAMLETLAKGSPPKDYRGSDGVIVTYTAEYRTALDRDIVGVCRAVVNAMRNSGAKRLGLWKQITTGNARMVYKPPVPVLRLLKDVETRWSSTYLMILRYFQLWRAVQDYLRESKDPSLMKHLMGDSEQLVLGDVLQVLEGAHAVQQVLSAEKTPTLSMSLPAYALLIRYWKDLSRSMPQLAYVMDVGIAKIQQYIDKSRGSKIHVLAMVVNPSTQLKWIEENWTSAEAMQAKKWVLEHMQVFQRVITQEKHAAAAAKPRSTGIPSPNLPFSLIQPDSTHGVTLSHILGLSTVRRSTSLSLDSPAVQSPLLPLIRENTPMPEPPPISPEDQDKLDKRAVELELENYLHDKPVDSRALDIMRFWQHNSNKYPTLYRIALDVLPAQASAVPCERIFSSSNETLTKRRNSLSSALVEALQHLKFLCRQQRLSFIDDQDVTEAMLSIEEEARMPVTRDVLRAALASEKPEEAIEEFINDIEGGV